MPQAPLLVVPPAPQQAQVLQVLQPAQAQLQRPVLLVQAVLPLARAAQRSACPGCKASPTPT